MRRMLFAAALLALLTIAAQVIADEYWGNWTQMDPSDHPSARDRVHMAYDSESDRAILFGGYNEVYHFDDTWAYDDNTDTWEQMNPGDRPSARRNHPMAYDSGSDRIVLFGGFDGYDYLGDTWAYDCNTDTWERMHPANAPTDRSLPAVAYDSENDRVILFGGTYQGAFLDDTWAYDYDTDTWTKMNPPSSPSPRTGHAMVYDAESDRIILFGGHPGAYEHLDDTWAYDYNSDTWEEMHPPAHPSDRSYLHMAYLAEADRAILFGGLYHEGQVSKYHADTWAYDYDANTWEELATPSHPCARRAYAFACVDEDNRVVLFGGWDESSFFDDTWAFRLELIERDDWRLMDPDPHPSARKLTRMAYDSESDFVILFGGFTDAVRFDDTWAYDCNTDTWQEIAPASSPAARSSYGLAYDAESDRVILFGGSDWDTYFADTWAYDHNTNTWEHMSSASHPCARRHHGMAYDAESDRVIMFGGYDAEGDRMNDTWAYDWNTDTWTQMSPPSSPAARVGQAMAYDAESDRVILFGGGYPSYWDDTWAYDYNTDTWTELSPADHPSARNQHDMAYDAESDRVILFGGEVSFDVLSDETWAYDYNTDTWDELHPPNRPMARLQHGMAYDAESERVVLFGGGRTHHHNFLDDTWTYGSVGFEAPYDWLWPGWNWIAIPAVPYDPDPTELFGFDCGGRLWYWDKYGKWHQVYRPPFVTFEMEVGPSYLMWLDEFPPPVSYDGYPPDMPFEFKMGRMGWTWLGKPGLQPLGAGGFMDTVMVRYPSDEGGELRTAREDWESGDPWLSWGWSFWDPYAQAPRTFTPYLPWHNVCYPWCGYRCWVTVGAALDESDPDQVTLIWP